MKKIIVNINENIQILLNLTHHRNTDVKSEQQTECNYTNNYYGDQLCQSMQVEQ
ncbi:MAG: hypothetical protein ACI89T_001099 [Cognaticolwellia sp.]|jgi:hypothetical protein